MGLRAYLPKSNPRRPAELRRRPASLSHFLSISRLSFLSFFSNGNVETCSLPAIQEEEHYDAPKEKKNQESISDLEGLR
ncbi:hypothetical protein L1987_21364 [Smallanthus sonchifolius]|uniref:Uncharacterized protein n=1 Tax=Smallanthus sonchifolius TaxID=185202 RepID=A0ACB9IVU0_9ASTR|nr:hypothetical protein L1987_21364 [Smallanthus sonchifolius]